MARPRTSAKILQLKGAFDKDPARKRQDSEGSAPFDIDPPAHLPQQAVPAWRYVVSRLPKVAIYNCDEVAVEQAALLLSAVWTLGVVAGLDHLKELRQWLAVLGMTPAARTKIPPHVPKEDAKNPFDNV